MRKIGVETGGGVLDVAGIDEGFRMIREAGFDCVDFGMDHCVRAGGGCAAFFARPLDDILEAARPYREAAEKCGLSFGQAHAPISLHESRLDYDDDRTIDAVKKSIAMCAYLNCSHLIIHPAFGDYAHRMDPDTEWEINIRQYGALIETLKKYHVTACLENMFTASRHKIYEAICSDFNEAAAYIDELNDMAGEKCFAFCLDTGHALLLSKDVYTAIMQLGDRLETLHIHDNDGKSDQHLPPYMGLLDWDRFLRGLREAGYQGNLSFETGPGTEVFDPELKGNLLRLIAATGRLFARRLDGE